MCQLYNVYETDQSTFALTGLMFLMDALREKCAKMKPLIFVCYTDGRDRVLTAAVCGTSRRFRRPPAMGRITSAGSSNRLPPVVAFVNTEGCTSGHSAVVSVGIGDTAEPIREVITSDMAEQMWKKSAKS
ncbi:hypothetical protein Tco_1326223 [Tanacetum coccineum]